MSENNEKQAKIIKKLLVSGNSVVSSHIHIPMVGGKNNLDFKWSSFQMVGTIDRTIAL